MGRLIASGSAIYAHECLLGQIDCSVIIIRHAVDVTRDLIAIPTNQFGERVFVARQSFFQQHVVRSLLNHDSRRHRGGEVQLLNRS